MTATDVEQTAKSPGAAAADPLSALAPRPESSGSSSRPSRRASPAAPGRKVPVVLIESIGSEDGAIRGVGQPRRRARRPPTPPPQGAAPCRRSRFPRRLSPDEASQ